MRRPDTLRAVFCAAEPAGLRRPAGVHYVFAAAAAADRTALRRPGGVARVVLTLDDRDGLRRPGGDLPAPRWAGISHQPLRPRALAAPGPPATRTRRPRRRAGAVRAGDELRGAGPPSSRPRRARAPAPARRRLAAAASVSPRSPPRPRARPRRPAPAGSAGATGPPAPARPARPGPVAASGSTGTDRARPAPARLVALRPPHALGLLDRRGQAVRRRRAGRRRRVAGRSPPAPRRRRSRRRPPPPGASHRGRHPAAGERRRARHRERAVDGSDRLAPDAAGGGSAGRIGAALHRRHERGRRVLPDPAVPAQPLPGGRRPVRHPVAGARGDQRGRDRLRLRRRRLIRGRGRLDAVHAGHLGRIRRRRRRPDRRPTRTTPPTRSSPPPRYLAANGGRTDINGAIFAYNHSAAYVQSVLLRATLIESFPATMINALTELSVGVPPVPMSAAEQAAIENPPLPGTTPAPSTGNAAPPVTTNSVLTPASLSASAAPVPGRVGGRGRDRAIAPSGATGTAGAAGAAGSSAATRRGRGGLERRRPLPARAARSATRRCCARRATPTSRRCATAASWPSGSPRGTAPT